MNKRNTSSVAVKNKAFKGVFLQTTAAVAIVASTSGITYLDSTVLMHQEVNSKQKNVSFFEFKSQNLSIPVEHKAYAKPKMLGFSGTSEEEGVRVLDYGYVKKMGSENLPITSKAQPVASDDDFDFVYADDFDTVDNSNDSKSVYVTLSYGGRLPAASDDDFDFVYADDFDTVDNSNDYKNISTQQATGGYLSDRRDRG